MSDEYQAFPSGGAPCAAFCGVVGAGFSGAGFSAAFPPLNSTRAASPRLNPIASSCPQVRLRMPKIRVTAFVNIFEYAAFRRFVGSTWSAGNRIFSFPSCRVLKN